jgi:hypothetical protein
VQIEKFEQSKNVGAGKQSRFKNSTHARSGIDRKKFMTTKKSWIQNRIEEQEKEDRLKMAMFAIFFVSTALHLSLFLTIVFNTLIPTIPLLIFYVLGTIALSYYLKKKSVKYSGWRAYVFFPLIINLLFTINYLLSWPESDETYKFHTTTENIQTGRRYSSRTERRLTTAIALEDDVYSEYLGIRVFKDVYVFSGKSTVTFHFNRGVLGLRVLRGYYFK